MINLRKVLPWILTILLMIIIFRLSHQPVNESRDLSNKITKIVIEKIEELNPGKRINKSRMDHIVRKNAHFFAYLFLGVLVFNGLRIGGVSGSKRFFLALIICVLYAISDEVHQLFVPGRGGQLRDVIIDSTGATVGILISYGFIYIFNKNSE